MPTVKPAIKNSFLALKCCIYGVFTLSMQSPRQMTKWLVLNYN